MGLVGVFGWGKMKKRWLWDGFFDEEGGGGGGGVRGSVGVKGMVKSGGRG